MAELHFHGRRAHQLENDLVRVTVTVEGGHIAEILHKASEVNPLWIPRWRSVEPSTYDPASHPEYGGHAESRLLCGLMGHNLCMDIFGGPTAAEAAAGMEVHGEGSNVRYDLEVVGSEMTCRAEFPLAALRFTRRIGLEAGSSVVRIRETVENLGAIDRPLAWTQHVSMGAPFIERGRTQFRVSATKSRVIESDFTGGKGYQETGADFDWPLCPRRDGGVQDLSVFPDLAVSAGYTAHLMDPAREQAFFLAWSPARRFVFGYVWRREDFPWLGRWEENRCREFAPWNGEELTCGMEFGVSPFPESRRAMVERGRLFGAPCYRWLPARGSAAVEYRAFVSEADELPESVAIDRGEIVFGGAGRAVEHRRR
jgi:hypothetical protein